MPFKPKLSKMQRELIIANPLNLSIAELARRYKITRRAVQFIRDPRRRTPVALRLSVLECISDKQGQASQSPLRGGLL
jgi:hypothetical protein